MKRKDLIVSTVIGFLIVVFVVMMSAERGYSMTHRLSDGCFTASVMLCGIGGIIFCSNRGAFNLLGFSTSHIIKLITGYGKDPGEQNHDAYYNYCMKQAEKPAKPFGHLLIVGAIYLLAAVLFLALYLMAT